jgi:hypothetical protein
LPVQVEGEAMSAPCGCTSTHFCAAAEAARAASQEPAEVGTAAFRTLLRHRGRWLAVPGCRERWEAHRSDEVDRERASGAGGGVGCQRGAGGEVKGL